MTEKVKDYDDRLKYLCEQMKGNPAYEGSYTIQVTRKTYCIEGRSTWENKVEGPDEDGRYLPGHTPYSPHVAEKKELVYKQTVKDADITKVICAFNGVAQND